MNDATQDVPLEVHEVSKSYGAVKALDRVSLNVRAGEFCVLLGPNGAGKSTLFQLLSGLYAPDSGELKVCGLDLRRNTTRALARLGIVFQQSTLDLDLSARGNLRFHARLHGLGRAAMQGIEQCLESVGLAQSTDWPCRNLSGGNRRKVELARALLHAPAVLLMDEATVGLDPASRRALLEQVRARCADEGLAVLWATHLVDEAVHADRVIVLHRGQKIADGPPAELVGAGGAANLAAWFLALTGSTPGGTV